LYHASIYTLANGKPRVSERTGALLLFSRAVKE